MMRIYVAGKLTANTVDYIKNIREMTIESVKLMKEGFSVFVPGWDFISVLVTGEFEVKDLFNNSEEWLKVSEAVYVCDNWRTSKGTKKEIKIAKKNKIPLFYNIKDLIKFRDNLQFKK